MSYLKAEKIKNAYQTLKEYKKNGNKGITNLAIQHKVANLGIVAKRIGILEELEKRNPTTDDAISCLEALWEYTNSKDKSTVAKVVTPSIENVVEEIKVKRARSKRKKVEKTKKISILWGALQLEW